MSYFFCSEFLSVLRSNGYKFERVVLGKLECAKSVAHAMRATHRLVRSADASVTVREPDNDSIDQSGLVEVLVGFGIRVRRRPSQPFLLRLSVL